MKLKKIFLIFFIYSLSYNNLLSIEPDIFVQSTVNRASKILSESSTKEKKIKDLQIIAKETVDIRGIGFYTLGATRKTLNEDDLTNISKKIVKSVEEKTGSLLRS